MSPTRELKQRHTAVSATSVFSPTGPNHKPADITFREDVDEQPAEDAKHGRAAQIVRLLLLSTYFLGSCTTICATQFLGAPLYWINRDLYYSYMALTKQSFGILITTTTQWLSPTFVRISGDESVSGQMRKTEDGRLECSFPERMVMIANHQLYVEWLYLWWIAYANRPPHHGHIYIILKESLKYVPILGQGMMFYGFIFMSRKMEKDKPRLAHRLRKLKQENSVSVSESKGLNPMWLLLFPEGTNLSDSSRTKSEIWAGKIGIRDMQHTLLPRSTGAFFCLNELRGTVDWVYDCTLAYEGIPRGKYGQDYFTLRSTYLEGRTPKSVNMYWRRFAVSEIPLDDPKEFDEWLLERWREKDSLMEEYMKSGRFPSLKVSEVDGMKTTVSSENGEGRYIETEIKAEHWWEFGKIFVLLATFGLVTSILGRIYNMTLHGNDSDLKHFQAPVAY